MSISKQPSTLSLPQTNPGVATVLEYLIIKFPFIDAQVWRQRVRDGKVHDYDGTLVTEQSLFKPQQRIYYYREVVCQSASFPPRLYASAFLSEEAQRVY
ncbi:hypothetical protein [Enterovibrio baiacu]|uniref:hypothetical protein n=1 Tax=Enterovibrio baiacu TaxID=2491023 RepID=UPI001F0C2F05|nr:hypothetical protein [Enterovibrio baiacu]